MDPPPEPYVERILRQADDEGEFDDLPGMGEPIPDLDRPYEPDWWVKRWLALEKGAEAHAVMAARIRREVPVILAGHDPVEARTRLEELNLAIDAINDSYDGVEPLPLLPVDELLAGRFPED